LFAAASVPRSNAHLWISRYKANVSLRGASRIFRRKRFLLNIIIVLVDNCPRWQPMAEIAHAIAVAMESATHKCSLQRTFVAAAIARVAIKRQRFLSDCGTRDRQFHNGLAELICVLPAGLQQGLPS
jgi:hypothetical protein